MQPWKPRSECCDHKPGKTRKPLEAEKGKELILPLSRQKEYALANILKLAL